MSRKVVKWDTVRIYFESLTGVSRKAAIAKTALNFSLSDRTVARKVRAQQWVVGLHRAQNVIDFKAASAELGGRIPSTQADHLRMINGAIAGIGGSLEKCIKTDLREAAAGASALCRLIELHRVIQPPNAQMLADAAINAGISPQEFIEALQTQWRSHG